MRRVSIAILLLGCWLSGPTQAEDQPATDVPLAEVLSVASRNAALYASIRLQLWRAKLTREDVVCRGHRFDGTWILLSGKKFGPYQCPIGGRTIFITATQSYYDAQGRKLLATDPGLMSKAARIAETNFKWRWR